jgi:uncharacterized protein YhaN
LALAKKQWARIIEKWDALHSERRALDDLREIYLDLSQSLRCWIEDQLSDEERTRLLNALRQHRYQARHSKELGSKTVALRVDRLAYEAATTGLPPRQKAIIVSLLLRRFAKDAALRGEILDEGSSREGLSKGR